MVNNAPPLETPNDTTTQSLQHQWLVVQIPDSEIYDNENEKSTPHEAPKPGTNSSWLERHVKAPTALSHKLRGSKATTGIRMTRAEFYAHFIKDEKTGEYRAGTTEPEGGRKAWLQQRLQCMKDDPANWDLWTQESRKLVATGGTGGIASFAGLGGYNG